MLITVSSVLLNIILAAAFIWLIIFIVAIVTLSRRLDMATPVKVFWAAVIFFAPFIGLILYLVFGMKRNNRNIKRY